MGTFNSNDELTEVKLGKGIESIDAYAFHGCINITEIDILENCKIIKYVAFADCSIEHLIIPNTVEKVENRAFENNEKLKTILIESRNTDIGKQSFANCGNLRRINYNESEIKSRIAKLFKKRQ